MSERYHGIVHKLALVPMLTQIWPWRENVYESETAGEINKMELLPSGFRLVLVCHSRVMKIIGLKLVGRNHYDPESAIIIGKHR